MKNLSTRKTLYLSLLIVELIIYLFFMIVDIGKINFDTTYIKYSGICLLFIFSFFAYSKWDKRHISFRIAYLCTLCADLFLLVLDKFYIIGLIFFVLAQLAYFIYINERIDVLEVFIKLLAYFFVFGASLLVLLIIDEVNALYILTLAYFIMLIENFINSIIEYKRKKHSIILPLGFFLFILCDINVGLNNLDFVWNNEVLSYLVSFSMWMFYLPSQVLIVSSLDFDNKNKKESTNEKEKYSQ